MIFTVTCLGKSMIRIIKRHPHYGVSDTGEVFNMGNSRKLKPEVSTGHPRVILDGQKEYVSQLVMEAFDRQRPNSTYRIFHIDLDNTNNDLSNLVWLSPSDIQKFTSYTEDYRREVLGRW